MRHIRFFGADFASFRPAFPGTLYFLMQIHRSVLTSPTLEFWRKHYFYNSARGEPKI